MEPEEVAKWGGANWLARNFYCKSIEILKFRWGRSPTFLPSMQLTIIPLLCFAQLFDIDDSLCPAVILYKIKH